MSFDPRSLSRKPSLDTQPSSSSDLPSDLSSDSQASQTENNTLDIPIEELLVLGEAMQDGDTARCNAWFSRLRRRNPMLSRAFWERVHAIETGTDTLPSWAENKEHMNRLGRAGHSRDTWLLDIPLPPQPLVHDKIPARRGAPGTRSFVVRRHCPPAPIRTHRRGLPSQAALVAVALPVCAALVAFKLFRKK